MRLPALSRREIAGLLARIAGLAVIYIITGLLGLKFAAVAGFATLVWPPSGISLAALLLLGYRVWPGIAIGAFIVNSWQGAPILVALGIAVGNTLEALLGAFALRRIPGFRESLDRVTDVIGLVVFAAGLSSLLSATVGTFSLVLGGLVPMAQFGVTWGAWWLGDAVADLVIAPLILTWSAVGRFSLKYSRWAEGTVLVAALAALTMLVFAAPAAVEANGFWRTYMISTPLVWAALRFGPPGAAIGVALVTALAITYTTEGTGPFAGGQLHQDLFFLQTFLGVLAITFLTVAAAVAERIHAQRARVAAERAEHAALIADQAKSDFVATMSHELRTPLTAIIGYADLLRDEITGPISDQQKNQLERIHVTSGHLTTLIDQILTFSRLESGRERIQLEPVDVAEILDEVATIAEPLVKTKGLRFTLERPPSMEPLVTDPGKLRQILLNLISNAVKFTDQGVVRLTGRVEDDRIRLEVQDTGIGIEPAHLEKIFEPFFQVEQGLDRKVGGTGLGLNVSRRLARAIGGELVVDSTLGQGSTFTVMCPRRSGAGVQPAPES